VVAALLTILDGSETDLAGVMVVATTNRPEAVDGALRRPGRFDRELEIGVPTPAQREGILRTVLAGVAHTLSEQAVSDLVATTHGFVGADLHALCNEAALHSLRTNLQSGYRAGQLETLRRVGADDFAAARVRVRPSAMREMTVEVPRVSWDDVGGLADVKQRLKEAVQWAHTHQEALERVGAKVPRGVLLYGPPGCSKTLLVRAVAHESGLNFLSVKGPELFSKWVGESEKALKKLFAQARAAAPSVVFFDEIDGLATSRGAGGEGGSDVSERVLNQLLHEVDGFQPLHGVAVVAATNRPDLLDPALLRPGRFDRLVYVPAPKDASARVEILQVHLRSTPLGSDVSLEQLADVTAGYTGADLAAVCREAGLAALEESLEATCVEARHYLHALRMVSPSVPPETDAFYQRFLRAAHA